MADEIDITTERNEHALSVTIEALRKKADEIPKGVKGFCDFCDEHFERVVEVFDKSTFTHVKSCGRCRDERGIL